MFSFLWDRGYKLSRIENHKLCAQNLPKNNKIKICLNGLGYKVIFSFISHICIYSEKLGHLDVVE